jgi:RNA polymerase sigma-70 factor, ECF subfamily
MKHHSVEYSDEPDFIARAQGGDREAFRHLVNFYEPRLASYLTHMLGDHESARDLVQETLLAAYRALPGWQPPTMVGTLTEIDDLNDEQRYFKQHPLAPWLYRIATNLALTYLRSQAKATLRQTPFALHAESWELQTQPRSMLDLEDRFATRELLREALSRLSHEDATCLLLRFVEGEHYAEIAAHLGISTEAVRKRVGRGLVTLRTVYRQLDQEVSL